MVPPLPLLVQSFVQRSMGGFGSWLALSLFALSRVKWWAALSLAGSWAFSRSIGLLLGHGDRVGSSFSRLGLRLVVSFL